MDHAAPPSLLCQQLPPARHSNLRRSTAQLLMLLGVESGVLWLNGLWTLTGQDRHHLVICLAWLAWFGFYRKAYVRRQTFWEELRQTVLAAMVFTMLSSRLLNQIPNWEQIRSALLLYPLLGCSIVPGRALATLALKQLGLWYQPVLVFGSGTTGIADAGAPSLEQPEVRRLGWYTANMLAYAAQGFIEIFPDYIGFNDPARPQRYFSKAAEGHVMLDAARAASSLASAPGTPVRAAAKVFAAGYSQGGHAAFSAADLRAS